MHSKRTLTKKQLAVIDELFAGDSDESAILQKYNVSRSVFNKWLKSENFKNEFSRRIEWANLQAQILIAKFASSAAARLVSLTNCEKEETARKACLDIISLTEADHAKNHSDTLADVVNNNDKPAQITSETAAKILEIMANEKAC